MGIVKRLFNWIFKQTLIYNIYNTIVLGNQYCKDTDIVGESLYSTAFANILKRYLNKEFKRDWIGRLYAVINPNIDIDGHINFSNSIIELDDERTNNEIYVQNWIYKQLQLVADVFKLENMYSYICMGIEHVGPKNADNYLIIFDIASRVDFIKSCKRTLLQVIFYVLIICIGLFIFV